MNLGFSKHDIKRGEKHPNHKLTEREVKEIRELYASGYWTQEGLAITFSVKRQTISAIITRRSWRHVQ